MQKINSFEIIAETAFTHQGKLSYLFKQIENAAKANADFIKFQILVDPENYFTKYSSSKDKISKLIFTEKEWVEAITYATKLNLKVLALPLTINSLKFLFKEQKMISAFEIHSVNFLEIPLLELFGKLKKTIIFLGVGGRIADEIEFIITKLKKHELILIHGFQSFPTDKKKLNLNKIKTYIQKYKCDVGYADHSAFNSNEFIELCKNAYLLGCNYFELHIINKKGANRIDHNSAHSSSDLLLLRKEIEGLNTILGITNIDNLNEKELLYRNREKKIVAKKELMINHKMNISDIDFRILEIAEKNSVKNINRIVGRKLLRKKQEHELFFEADFEN
jgi:N,N'-diacetyllegionaminate synthase